MVVVGNLDFWTFTKSRTIWIFFHVGHIGVIEITVKWKHRLMHAQKVTGLNHECHEFTLNDMSHLEQTAKV